MNWIDVLLIAVILLSLWSGWQKGFLAGLANLITWAGSLAAGFFFYPNVSVFVRKIVSLGVWTIPVSFILTVIVARIFLSVLCNWLLQYAPQETHRQSWNKTLGLLPGFANGLINATVVAALLLALPLVNGLSDKVHDSKLATKFTAPADWMKGKLSSIFNEAVNKSLHKPTAKQGGKERINLPFTDKNPEVREDLEAQMLVLVNGERQKEGLKPLKGDSEIRVVARAHSKDMFARGYFAHTNPDGEDPFDRIQAARIRYTTAGENLALAQTLITAHKGLMESPGHRANILKPSFGRVGIGILDGGLYGLMITQNFRN